MNNSTLRRSVITITFALTVMVPLTSAAGENVFDWRDHISIVDSSLSQKAMENIERVDRQMLFHMNNLQALVQQQLTNFQPVIVAQFTPGGGKFTLLRNEYGNESRVTVEPVPRLFALSKSLAHAPLGIYGSFEPYSVDPDNQGWRDPVTSYREVLADALAGIDDVKIQLDETLKSRLVTNLNTITAKFADSDPQLTESTVIPHIIDVWKRLLTSAIGFIDTKLLSLKTNQSPAEAFQKWANQTGDDLENPKNTLYKLIVQSQVIAATTQQYGISSLIRKWKGTFTAEEWKKLYVIVEAEWVTREMNSIAQIILPEMADQGKALGEHLMIVTNLSGVESALHFLARILEDRAAAALILTGHTSPRNHLSGHVDLLGPVMQEVVSGAQKELN